MPGAKTSMKILLVIPYLASAYGGTSQVVKALAHHLGQLGATVDIITTNAADGDTATVPTDRWVEESSYRVRYFPAWHRSDLIVSPGLLKWLLNHVRQYDIVHTHTLFSPLMALTHGICRLLQRPYVMTPHGMLDAWALAYKAWKKKLYYSAVEKSFLAHSSAIQVLSTTERENVEQLAHNQAVLIPNGIHQDQFQALPDAGLFYQQFPHLRGKKLILFLGRIDPKKGLDLLAPAFATVHGVYPDAHLVLAGPDSINFTPTVREYLADAFAQARGEGETHKESVTFAGMLSGPIKYAALAAATIYVSPSYSEGFSMSVLEGMASGLPCVITTGCNFPEAAAHQAAHVVETEVEAIATALIDCLEHPKEAKEMGDRARQFIFDHYTWENAAETLLKTYQCIIQASNT